MAAAIGTNPALAAQILRRGGLVAFPTETVYGLGADARSEPAVRRVFAVKGRPADHPLIVHLAEPAQLREWAIDIPADAELLAREFWPGPLTLILRKHPAALSIVTGSQDTIGVRVPAHPLALSLLRKFGGGIAAPSANRFGRVSPTTAAHVSFDLGPEVDYILDGGPCPVGIESTILDLSSEGPVLLRPGAITVDELRRVLGSAIGSAGSRVRAPGTLSQHYSPRARVELCCGQALVRRAAELILAGQRCHALSTLRPAGLPADVVWHCLPEAPRDAAHELYALLRAADGADANVILACPPDPAGIGAAVADRLARAAGAGSLPEAT